jgi:alpha-beta hydrolase superfamily lysophospholipase
METLRTADGLSLHLRHWPRPGARGQVLIVHGLGEHIDRYDAVARSLQAQGWAVSGYDQRGHGRSEGPRGTIPADDSLCADLAEVVDALRGAGAKRVVLLGHSMGGLVAARFVAEALVEAAGKAWSRRSTPGAVVAGARPRHERLPEVPARGAGPAGAGAGGEQRAQA